MRYFLVTYVKRPNGETNEVVSITTKINNHDMDRASVILDFKTKKILKASLGQAIPHDWPTISTYYNQHYPGIFEDLYQKYP